MALDEKDTFDCCAFCPTESRRGLYKCPKCSRFYCSKRCYRSRAHVQCSERFYQSECEAAAGVSASQPKLECGKPLNRPTTTFEEYMREKRAERNPQHFMADDEANPQIEVKADEEVLFDSDDEPDYLLDVARASADQFEKLEMHELDRRLMAAGISPGIGVSAGEGGSSVDEQRLMESLFQRLTADERRAFARLADEMIDDGAQESSSCFRASSIQQKKKKNSAKRSEIEYLIKN